MATKTTAVTAPFGAVSTFRVGYFLDTMYQGFVSWNDKRKTANALKALSDDQLKDIGFTRGDLDNF